MTALWALFADRLDQHGLDWRGRVTLPEDLGPGDRLAVKSLAGREVRRQVTLAHVEHGLRSLGLGDDLPSALATLGAPVTGVRQQRRIRRLEAAASRELVRRFAARWPEPWATAWADDLIQAGIVAGLNETEAASLVTSTRRVLDALTAPPAEPQSRVELAARVAGSAHALDRGTRLERAVSKALALSLEADPDDGLWERAGAHADLVSGAALTWNLRLRGDHPLANVARDSTALGVPLVMTQLALRRAPLQVDASVPILVVENPRLLEYAALSRASGTVICGNGNPSSTVRVAITQLLNLGVEVRYHGDFDPAGLAICSRMAALGVRPWRMGSADYLAALDAADRDGISLPVADGDAGPTPWDPGLRGAFNRRRLVVHEERVLETVVE